MRRSTLAADCAVATPADPGIAGGRSEIYRGRGRPPRHCPSWIGRALFVFAVVQVTLFVSLRATAAGLTAPDANRVAVYVEGSDAKSVRRDVVGALPDSMTVVDEGKTDAAVRAAGLKGRLSEALSTEDMRKRVAPKLAKTAARLGAGTIVVASVPKGKGERDIAVLVVRGKNDVMFDTVTVDLKDGPASKAYKWESFVAATVSSSSEAPAEKQPSADKKAIAEKKSEPEPERPKEKPRSEKQEVEPREEPKQEPERDSGGSERAAKHDEGRLDRALATIGVAYDSGTRGFSYTDPVTSNLRPYNVTNTPGIGAAVEIYPLAGAHQAILPDIGLEARMARSFSFDSSTSNGQSVSTTWQDIEVGLRGRIHTGADGRAPLLGLGAAYSNSAFDFGTTAAAKDLPSAEYKMLRMTFDGRIPFGSFAALAEASYLQILDAAPMTDRFPHASVHGLGGRIGAAARALPWLEGRLEFRYDHIVYKMFPEVGDRYVAGGGLDQRLSISLGAYAFF